MAVSISIAIDQNSQSVANNKSDVTVKVTAKWTGGSWNATGQCTGSITIDGTKYSFSGITFNTGRKTSGSEVIMTKTVDVAHNSDGKKTLNCSASFVTGVSSGTVSASASKVLTTIPRKSSLTVANGTLGTEQTIKITEQASSMVHKLTYKCGDVSGYILGSSSATSTALSVDWTPPLSLAQQNTTGSSVSITFTLYTYSGSTQVGSNAYTKTFSIPSSVKPSVSIAVSDPTGHFDTYGKYIQMMSKINVEITASGSQGSTIKAFKVTANGKTYTTDSFETDVIANSGSQPITVTVTDSRGRTTTVSKTISVLAYEVPKINDFAVYRCDSAGASNSSGAYLAVKFGASITPLENKNDALYTVKYKKSNDTAYTTVSLTDYTGDYTVSDGVFVFPADTASSYDVILTAADDFKSISRNAVGSSIKKLWSILSRGMGLAIGKIAELEDVFDVGFVIRARKGIIVDSEWVDLTIANNFALYGNSVANQPKCKITGNVVTVMGILTTEKEFVSSTTGVAIASGIPANMRPPVNLQFVCQGSAMNRWACSVTTSGTVTISRYGTTEATTVTVGAWLPFCVTYQI